MALKLDRIVPWGRSFDEYCRVFALSEDDLAMHILGCGDGPASFNADATAKGHSVISCDPVYALSPAEIEQRVEQSYGTVLDQLRNNLDGFLWNYFRDPDHLGQCRLAAMRGFLADFVRGKAEGRYVTAALPRLPFRDGEFDLALVSHLLFLYTEQLDFEFHRAACRELLRVAAEVRIFPLLKVDGQKSSFVEPIREELAELGLYSDIVAVSYEFQRGGKEMLRIRRNSRPPRIDVLRAL